MKHAIGVNLCVGNLHYVPHNDPQGTLNLGAGLEYGRLIVSQIPPTSFKSNPSLSKTIKVEDEYPSATVLGIDLN